jgi:hypothetical protein
MQGHPPPRRFRLTCGGAGTDAPSQLPGNIAISQKGEAA